MCLVMLFPLHNRFVGLTNASAVRRIASSLRNHIFLPSLATNPIKTIRQPAATPRANDFNESEPSGLVVSRFYRTHSDRTQLNHQRQA